MQARRTITITIDGEWDAILAEAETITTSASKRDGVTNLRIEHRVDLLNNDGSIVSVADMMKAMRATRRLVTGRS